MTGEITDAAVTAQYIREQLRIVDALQKAISESQTSAAVIPSQLISRVMRILTPATKWLHNPMVYLQDVQENSTLSIGVIGGYIDSLEMCKLADFILLTTEFCMRVLAAQDKDEITHIISKSEYSFNFLLDLLPNSICCLMWCTLARTHLESLIILRIKIRGDTQAHEKELYAVSVLRKAAGRSHEFLTSTGCLEHLMDAETGLYRAHINYEPDILSTHNFFTLRYAAGFHTPIPREIISHLFTHCFRIDTSFGSPMYHVSTVDMYDCRNTVCGLLILFMYESAQADKRISNFEALGITLKKLSQLKDSIMLTFNHDHYLWGPIPEGEPHLGYSYVAATALALIKYFSNKYFNDSLGISEIFNKERCEQGIANLINLDTGGYRGRAYKSDDACYSFWALGTMVGMDELCSPSESSLTNRHLCMPNYIAYLLRCQDSVSGAFKKCVSCYSGTLTDNGDPNSGDLFHTCWALVSMQNSVAQNLFFTRDSNSSP